MLSPQPPISLLLSISHVELSGETLSEQVSTSRLDCRLLLCTGAGEQDGPGVRKDGPVAAPAWRGELGTMWVTGLVHLPSEVRMWWGAPGNPERFLAGEPTDAKVLAQFLGPLLRVADRRQPRASPRAVGWVPGTTQGVG